MYKSSVSESADPSTGGCRSGCLVGVIAAVYQPPPRQPSDRFERTIEAPGV